MTVFLRDMSHYDAEESLTGYVGATHKVTEGLSYVDAAYGRRLNGWRAAGVRVLGSYHVLHTGNLAAQLQHWLSTLDALTPWWRTFPHWVMQVDAERWQNDNVSAATILQFARLLVGARVPGWKVTYASRGQYGDQLAGIPTPLWNAAYHSSGYPGDSAADWRPYSGQVPVLWQFTSTPYDRNAYRGSLDGLLALIGGNDVALTADEARKLNNTEYLVNCLALGIDPDPKRIDWGSGPGKGVPDGPNPFATLGKKIDALPEPTLDARLTAIEQALAGVSAKVDALATPLVGDVTVSGTLHVES